MRIPNEVAIHLLTLDLPPMSPPKPKLTNRGVLGICPAGRLQLVCSSCYL